MSIVVLDFFQRQVKPLGKCNCIVFLSELRDSFFVAGEIAAGG
jgi:hypothetical protein